MDARRGNQPAALLLVFGILALVTGLVISSLDTLWVIAAVAGVVAVGLVVYDYRVGVICLTFLLPWFSSPLVPQMRGFNLINFLIVASAISLAIHRSFGSVPIVSLPKVVRWCYLLPIAVATLVALPHLPEGAANFPARAPAYYQEFVPAEFLKQRIFKPLFFVFYSFLVANSVRDTERPERLLIAFGLSAVLTAVAIIASAMTGGASVEQRGSYLQELGLHPNSYGTLLALAAGPLLFLTTGSGSRISRLASGLAFGIVSAGLLLTGSRGAVMAYIVVSLFWLLRRKRLSDLFLAAILAAVLAVAVPDNVWDRLSLGLDDPQATSARNMDDPLTKGRLASWALLAPDILISPVWGQGIGSVAWNKATTAGRYSATLSHNMYVDMVLDLGSAGLAALLYLYYRYAQGFRILSREVKLSPTLRDYFSGAFASFLGMLAMGVTNGFYMPHPEQTFLWFALGLLFANWPNNSRTLRQTPSGSGRK